jgi:hypothetical protein
VVLELAVPIRHVVGQERVRAATYLFGGAVVELQAFGSTADVDAEGQPGDLGLVDALAFVAAEEEVVVVRLAQGADEAQLGGAEVLALIDNAQALTS